MFQVAAGNIIITPHTPVPLAGFADRTADYEGITDALEINLTIIREQQRLYLLYAIDTFFIPGDFLKAILEKFGTQWQLKEEQVWLCASHTHFAPSLDAEKPRMGVCSAAYYQFVKEKMLSLTDEVLHSTFSEATLVYAKGHAALNVNRRKRLLRPAGWKLRMKTLMYPDYDGRRDTTLHSLAVISAQNKVLACIWSYACHPVHAFYRNRVSADYVGIIRSNIRQHNDNKRLPVLFLQGFSGNLKADITAVTHTRHTDGIRYGLQLWPAYTQFPTAGHYNDWVALLWGKWKDIFSSENKIQIKAGLKSAIYKTPLSEIIGAYKQDWVIFKRLDIGEHLCMIGVSAEVATEYTGMVRQALPKENIICVGCTDNTRIYLPTDEMLKEGGYEVSGFKRLFHINGNFKPSLNEKFQKAVAALNG